MLYVGASKEVCGKRSRKEVASARKKGLAVQDIIKLKRFMG
jgi:hypothetical protein